MNPEFLRQGEAVEDFMHPDRIVLGGLDGRSINAMDALYQYFPGVDVVRTTNKTAEMIKYAANSLLATLISFSNEIGNLCSALGGIDSVDVMKGVYLDKRFSPIQPGGSRVMPDFLRYLEAGCGFGGSCFPKDVKALISHGKAASLPMHVLDAVIRVNDDQPQEVLRLLGKHFSSMNGLRIAILGLAFKPGTADMRESPAIPIVRALRSQGAHVKAFDPVARYEAKRCFNGDGVIYSDSLEQAVREVDAVVLLTRWAQFDAVPDLLLGLEAPPVVIDGRRMLDKRRISRYEGIGM
jgi:UDPglucose 6-dehydrogenase/GDP-mannose 6-dehydrogenase